MPSNWEESSLRPHDADANFESDEDRQPLMEQGSSKSAYDHDFRPSKIFTTSNSSGTYVSLQEVNLNAKDNSLQIEEQEEEDNGPTKFSGRSLPRSISLTRRPWINVAAISLLALVFIYLFLKAFILPSNRVEKSSTEPVCTSKLWSNGHWQPRPPFMMPIQPPISTMDEMMKVSNFPSQKCASNRLPLTNTALPRLKNNTLEYWDWRYQVSSYEWFSGCQSAGIPLKPRPTPESLINHLIDEGGWLFIGDSLSAQWFMSLSCFLEPYIIATPYWTEKVFWGSPQHIYLNPNSTFVRELKLPDGFDIQVTPLVSILRSGLLVSRSETRRIIEKYRLVDDDKPLFGNDTVFDGNTTEYIAAFLDPRFRYSKMIASAGAHYTQKLFRERPLFQIAEIFHRNFEYWADKMLKALEDPRAKNKKIFYRTATSGHHNCNNFRKTGPWSEEHTLETPVYNWQTIPLFNKIADAVMTNLQQPRFQLMEIDRPAMLRPDAHLLIDCLHFTVGSGVVEGWTEYLYNYT